MKAQNIFKKFVTQKVESLQVTRVVVVFGFLVVVVFWVEVLGVVDVFSVVDFCVVVF
ncbi:hypothetical protein [Klebsiella pneumoniae]|uniref:hypothetical protein n=1 Tax=Klebsiella pneumoniae TaxID=573 RepID=UPI003D365005